MSQPEPKKVYFHSFQWEMMQGSSGFISTSAATIVHTEKTSLMDRWVGFEDRGPECHPHLQTKTLPEKPPLMKWTGQRNKAWAKHLLADYYYLVNKARKRMRMAHYMSDYLLDSFWHSMKQIPHPSVFSLWVWSMEVRSCEAERYELKPISKQRNERQAK